MSAAEYRMAGVHFMWWMNVLLEMVFWTSAALATYTYIGYPILVWCLARTQHRDAPAAGSDSALPHVSLLISAFNEEREIAQRIENALAMDYLPEKLEIVI